MGKTKTFYTGHITLEKNSRIPEWKQKKIQKSFPYSWWTLKVKHPSARLRDPFKTAMCPTHPTGNEGTYTKLTCDKGVACWTSKGDQSRPGGSFFFTPRGRVGGWGGGVAVFNKCLYPPRGPPLYPLYTIFVYLLLTNVTSLPSIPFPTAVNINALVFK